MNFDHKNLLSVINAEESLSLVGGVADAMRRECYVVGGYVRDIFLERINEDIDFVTIGSGIELARQAWIKAGKPSKLSTFKNYGTAQFVCHRRELEFVGARRESYRPESRNPIVEDGTLEDDQLRRDFTINAMAISLNKSTWGMLLDPFNGLDDLRNGIIRTPCDPDITFSDDPLRMMRAVRFATQLNFQIFPDTLKAIQRNAGRIKIITPERIATELSKIIRCSKPSRGFFLLDKTGLLHYIFPELAALKGVELKKGRAHKDNFIHTMQVLDTVSQSSDNEWLRWAALMHDIGKPATKQFDNDKGNWTFINHNFIGAKMVPRIFARLRLPMDDRMKYVKKLVGLHMRPIALIEDIVTDSAVRRMLFEAGDDIDDLMILCKADITSKNQEKVRRFRNNFELVQKKLIDIEEKDRVRNFQPPIDGAEIMATFDLKPSKPVGIIKDAIKDAILDGVIANDYAQAHGLMLRKAEEIGITPSNDMLLCYSSMHSPVGKLTIAATAKGLAMLHIEGGKCNAQDSLNEIAKKKSLRLSETSTPLLEQCQKQLTEYFSKERKKFSLPFDVECTDFQSQVWKAMAEIPYGSTMTYGGLSTLIGKPKALRAVATACKANIIPIIIPCHRVVPAHNPPGNYSAGQGSTTKSQLLDLEAE